MNNKEQCGTCKVKDMAIWQLLYEAVQISLDVCRDMVKDEDDIDNFEFYAEQLLKTIELYRLLQKESDVSKITWTLEQIEWLKFITGQMVSIHSDDKQILRTLRRNKISPSY